MRDTVQLVGKEHVIAGIPFYTRIWTTTDGNTTSRAVGMQAAVDQLNSDGQVALWNDDCGTVCCFIYCGKCHKTDMV